MRSPGPCAVQARMFPTEATQASVYTHLACNGARKEWSSCQKREKRESILARKYGNPHTYFIGRTSSSTVKPNLKEAFVEPDILRVAEKLTPQQLAAVILN